MLQSKLFTKTRKEAPKDEVSKNAQLLIKGGFINKEMAGVYDYLPLGLKVLKKIESIIREEMNAIGAQEVLMTTLQDPELWKKTNRWDDKVVDNWFKSKLATGSEIGIANTHEEPMTEMLTHFVNSYKDLPVYTYQFQTKFRNELRAKSGIMRCREFLMKDLYSFDSTEADFKIFYEKCAEAYLRVFKRCGLGDFTFRTVAAGGSFTTGFTDEFQTISTSGEDIIYLDRSKKLAINKEVYNDETIKKFGLDKSKLEEIKSIEVGNIFPLGTRYPDALGLQIKNDKGVSQTVYMGSYGIGLGRLLGTVVEVLSDDKGIVWPASIAPFAVHVLDISNSEKSKAVTAKLYADLQKAGIEVLCDEREARAGEKFADSDLLGIPWRVIVSEKTIEKGEFEVKERATGTVSMIKETELIKWISSKK
jgi:prolyl-tRNA synthetase